MIRVFLAVATLAMLLAARPAMSQRSGEPPRERLGARLSFSGTAGKLNSHFGNGYDLTLYFTERIWRPLYLEIRIGATYFGDLLVPEIGEDFTRTEGIASEMRLAYVTAGPQYTWPYSDTQTFYVGFGLGIFTVSMLFDTGLQAFDLSDQHFGLGAGGGMYWRITDNWNIEVGATVNTLWTGGDSLYPIFTEGGRNPIVAALGLGLAIDLR